MKDIVKLQEDANVFKVVGNKCNKNFIVNSCQKLTYFQIISLGIILLSSIGAHTSKAFSITAAVVYASANTTTLSNPLNEDQISWLSKYCEYGCFLKFTTTPL